MNLEALITSVVMVGHSLFGPDNPVMLQQLLAEQSAAPAKITVEAQIINGAPLSYNWQHGDSAEGINARQRLAAPVDVVIVTEDGCDVISKGVPKTRAEIEKRVGQKGLLHRR